MKGIEKTVSKQFKTEKGTSLSHKKSREHLASDTAKFSGIKQCVTPPLLLL